MIDPGSRRDRLYIIVRKFSANTLTESSKLILDITTKMELHSQSVLLQRNLPRPPSPQEVFEIEPEESVNVKNEEDEEKVKVEKPKY